MAEEQSRIAIVIEAENKATEQIRQVEIDLSKLSASALKDAGAFAAAGAEQNKAIQGYLNYLKETNQSIADLNKEISGTTVPTQNLTDAIGGISMASITAALKIAGITLALGELVLQLKEATQIAGQMETSLIGVSATARMFGEDAQKARDAAKSLTEDGLMAQTQAAEGLQEIMYTGLGLEEATLLMERFKDMAAFGGKTTISYNDKIRMLFESFRTGYSIQAKNAGMMLTWAQVMAIGAKELGKKTEYLTIAEQAEAKYLGLMKMTAGEAGQSSLITKTYAGEIAKLNTAKIELMDTVGRGLLPAFTEFSELLIQVMKNLAGLRVVSQVVGTVFWMLQFIAKEAANFINGYIATIILNWQTLIEAASKITLDPRSWLEAGKTAIQSFGRQSKDLWQTVEDDALKIAIDTQLGLEKTWGKGTKDITSGVEKASNEWLNEISKALQAALDKQAKALKKMNEDLEKENTNYVRAVAKRAKQFQESFDDLVIAHRDAIKKVTDDLTKESKDYNKKLQDLLTDYNTAMDEVEVRHKDKTKSIMKDMEDERKKTLEEIEEITEAYNKEVTLIQREGESRLGNLQSQLDRELALGDNANQEKIAALRQMIAYEQDGLKTSLDEKKATYDEEISDVNEKLNDRLQDLKDELAEEDIAYTESFAKRKTQYENDLAEAKASYEEKRASLQEELDKEVAIREKYAEDFKRIGDMVAEDDLTRLKRKYNEEKIEAEAEHKERLAEIKARAFEQGLTTADSLAEGFDAGYPQIKERIDQIGDDLDQVISKVDTFSSKVGKLGDFYAPQTYPGGNYPYYGQRGGIFSKPTIVGEAGAEVVLPLNFPSRMAMIMKSMGIGGQGGGQVVQNFYVKVESKQDVDVLMERAGFAMKNKGGLS